MSAVRDYNSVQIGDTLPEQTHTPGNLDLNLLNMGNWASHRIHYDKDRALQEGFEDVVVQGVLLYAWVEKMLVAWAGDPGCLKKFNAMNKALPYVNRSYTVTAEVSEKQDDSRVVCSFKVTGEDGTIYLDGTAIIKLA